MQPQPWTTNAKFLDCWEKRASQRHQFCYAEYFQILNPVAIINHCFKLQFHFQLTAASIARAKNNCVKTQAYSFNISFRQIRHKTNSHWLGRNRSPETGARDWQPQQIFSPECDRHSFGFLLCLSGASSCERRTPSRSPPRFYQHISCWKYRASP